MYANLTKINEAVAEELQLEASSVNVGMDDDLHEEKLKKYFAFELEYNTRDDKVYRMKDLTMRSWLSLAERIGRTSYVPQSDITDNIGDEITEFETMEQESEKEPRSGPQDHETDSLSIEELDDHVQATASEHDLDIDLICLLWLKKHRGQQLTRHNTPTNPSWPDWFTSAITSKLELMQNQAELSLDLSESDDDDSDEGYDSMIEDESDADADSAEDGDSGIEDDEATVAKKKKHKKDKKKRKRKEKSLKKNHLWHAFVKRAFVGTKGDSELGDDFG